MYTPPPMSGATPDPANDDELDARIKVVLDLPPKAFRAVIPWLVEAALRRPALREARDTPPLVMISQVQRSGGTLLSRLADGHPELLAYPHELKIGFSRKGWPRLAMDQSPLEWLGMLFHPGLLQMASRGYSKPGRNTFAAAESHPFTFDFPTFCYAFLARAEGARRPRQVIDAYFSAFFAAWAEAPPAVGQRWTVAFCPQLICETAGAERLFDDYPDGRLISCVREPLSWYASAVGHTARFSDLKEAVTQWTASLDAGLAAQDTWPDAVRLVRYETLVRRPRDTVGDLAQWLGIDGEFPGLIQPTYAGRPVAPNSSFQAPDKGIDATAADRSGRLSAAQREEVAALTADALRRLGETRAA